jgi:hypothetical protein
MASQYTGTSTNTQAPSAAPSFTAAPIGNLPADGDYLNVSSVLQAFKVCLDFIDFLRLKLAPYKGVRTYESGEAYVVGDLVQYATNGNHYKCILASTGNAPTNVTYWVAWATSVADVDDQIDAKLGTLSGEVTDGVAFTAGATLQSGQHLNMPGTTHKVLNLVARIVTADGLGTTVITLSGATAFSNAAKTAQATSAVTLLASTVTASITSATEITVGINVSGESGAGTADVYLSISGW